MYACGSNLEVRKYKTYVGRGISHNIYLIIANEGCFIAFQGSQCHSQQIVSEEGRGAKIKVKVIIGHSNIKLQRTR